MPFRLHAGRTGVYRLYDKDDRLLYVGISCVPEVRLSEHSKRQPWWSRVTRQRIEYFATRAEALAVEANAIHKENPEFNATGVGRHPKSVYRIKDTSVAAVAGALVPRVTGTTTSQPAN